MLTSALVKSDLVLIDFILVCSIQNWAEDIYFRELDLHYPGVIDAMVRNLNISLIIIFPLYLSIFILFWLATWYQAEGDHDWSFEHFLVHFFLWYHAQSQVLFLFFVFLFYFIFKVQSDIGCLYLLWRNADPKNGFNLFLFLSRYIVGSMQLITTQHYGSEFLMQYKPFGKLGVTLVLL